MGTGNLRPDQLREEKARSAYGMLVYEGAEEYLRGLIQITSEFFHKFNEFICSTDVTWRNDPEQANQPAETLEAILRLIRLRVQFENDFHHRFDWVEEAKITQALDQRREELAQDLVRASWDALRSHLKPEAEPAAFKAFEKEWWKVLAQHRLRPWRTPLPTEKPPMDGTTTFNFEDDGY